MKHSHLALIIGLIFHGVGCMQTEHISRLGASPEARSLSVRPACSASLKPSVWSVSVGIDRYIDSNIPTLTGASHDAWVMHHFFASPNGGSVPIQQRMILLNHQATRANIEFALGRFLARACPQDTVYLYFAGHGASEPGRREDAFLFTHDTQLNNLVGTAISMRQLPQFLKWRAGRVGKLMMFLDTCHSGSIDFPKGRGVVINDDARLSHTTSSPDHRPPNQTQSLQARTSENIPKASQLSGRDQASAILRQLKSLREVRPEVKSQWSVLTAASSDQAAGEYADESHCPYTAAGYRGGLFTCSLLEGMRGGVKSDSIRSRRQIKLSHLHTFVEGRVSELSQGVQTPQWLGGDIEIPVLRAPLDVPHIPSELLSPPTLERSTLTSAGLWSSAAATITTLAFSVGTLQNWNQVQIYHNDGRVTVSAERYQQAEAHYRDSLIPLKWSAITTGTLLLGTAISHAIDQSYRPQTPKQRWFTIDPTR